MRTTIIIDDALWPQLRDIALKKRLSDFINRCLRAYLHQEKQAKQRTVLEQAYARASKATKQQNEFAAVDREGWPEW